VKENCTRTSSTHCLQAFRRGFCC